MAPQVLRDHHPAVGVGTRGDIDATALADWHRRCKSFLKAKTAESRNAKKATWAKRGVSNYDSLLSMDHTLYVSTGLSFDCFLPERPVKALGENEERYFVNAEDLPSHLAIARGFFTRSCVRNRATGERRLEVAWTAKRMLAVEAADNGSIGFGAHVYLYGRGGCRGCWFPDPSHVRWDHFKNSVNASGLSESWQEMKVLVSLRKGPWQGAAHFATLRSAMENAQAIGDYKTDNVFPLTYPYIVEDLSKGKTPPSFGTDEHMESVWETMPNAPLFCKTGTIDKASRWFDLISNFDDIAPYCGMLLDTVLRIGIERNYYVDVSDTGLFSEGIVPQPTATHASLASAPSVAAGPSSQQPATSSSSSSTPLVVAVTPAKPKTEKEAKAALDEERKTKNTIQVACNILCNRNGMKPKRALLLFGRISRAAHREHSELCSTQKGCVEWWSMMASGSWQKTVLEYLNVVKDTSLLLEIGFQPQGTVLHPGSIEEHVEENLCETVLTVLVNLLGTEIKDSRWYSDALPGLFGGFHSYDDDAAKACMRKCTAIWEAWVELERLALEDDFFSNFVLNLVYSEMLWVREVCIGLSENRGQSLPDPVRDETLQVARCLKGSRTNENWFNGLRCDERLRKSSRLGRIARWHRLAISDVLPDEDRRPLEVP